MSVIAELDDTMNMETKAVRQWLETHPETVAMLERVDEGRRVHKLYVALYESLNIDVAKVDKLTFDFVAYSFERIEWDKLFTSAVLV